MEKGLDIGSATAFMNDVAEVWRYSLNLATGEVIEANLTPNCWTDFPAIPKQHVGQPTRYCYSPVNNPDIQAYALFP
jgi:carotenoid cleavage dioxygenase-like enzyme